jgi:hypothetical protein
VEPGVPNHPTLCTLASLRDLPQPFLEERDFAPMGGDATTWKVIGEAIPRIEIALEAEEQFGIQLPEDVSHWLTLQDAYDTIALALKSQKGNSPIELAYLSSFLFQVIEKGYILKEGILLDLNFSFDEIHRWKSPT